MAKVGATQFVKLKEKLLQNYLVYFSFLLPVDFCMILLTIKFFGRTANFTGFF